MTQKYVERGVVAIAIILFGFALLGPLFAGLDLEYAIVIALLLIAHVLVVSGILLIETLRELAENHTVDRMAELDQRRLMTEWLCDAIRTGIR